MHGAASAAYAQLIRHRVMPNVIAAACPAILQPDFPNEALPAPTGQLFISDCRTSEGHEQPCTAISALTSVAIAECGLGLADAG